MKQKHKRLYDRYYYEQALQYKYPLTRLRQLPTSWLLHMKCIIMFCEIKRTITDNGNQITERI